MDLLTKLLQALDEGAPRRATLENYYAGKQPMAFLTPEARDAIGGRFGRMATNVPKLAVTALAERLRVTGFRTPDGPAAQVWDDWLANDLDELSGIAHREALALTESFVIVWADAAGNPLVSVESAEQVAALRDPATRNVIAAIKRWETDVSTEAVMYEPNLITRLSCPSRGATITGFNVVETIQNPLGVVPVVPLRNNSDRILGPASSEIDDLVPLVDALNKTLADMLVTSEYGSRPRRWATGIELVEEPVLDADGRPTGEMQVVNPIPEGSRAMISENPDTKFGQLAAAELAGYESAIRVLEGQIAAVSALPAHYLGVLGDQPPSADSLRAAEASLTARAEARQQSFGRAWEQVARLMVAVRTGQDPARIPMRVVWADAATRGIAQEADAAVKLHAAGLLPTAWTLARLGYTATDAEQIMAALAAETTTNPKGI